MYLIGDTESLELVTSTVAPIHVVANFMDHDVNGGVTGASESIINTATTTVIVAAVAASVTRQVKTASIRNTSNSSANQLTVLKDVGGVEHELLKVTLAVGETLLYSESNGWKVLTSSGQVKQVNPEQEVVDGYPIPFFKVGTVPEAAGSYYSFHKDAGLPGVWAPGTPGINGRATDGLALADAGCICPSDAPAGRFNYLTRFSSNNSIAGGLMLIDILWVNSGLVVTTTTAQAISAVTPAARDRNGTSAGLDIQMGLLVTGATTNAAAIANMTAVYTDSNGNTGNTATVASYPATAVIGTLVPFRLAAGDVGVRVPESVSFGTSLGGGSVSLILYRVLDLAGNPLANAGQYTAAEKQQPGFKLHNRTCGILVGIASSASVITTQGLVGITVR